MSEQRLIDANVLQEEFEWLKSNVSECGRDSIQDAIERIKRAPTISHEHLQIVRELREKLEHTDQELRNVKYCYDIAKNGESQLRRQVNEVTAEWAKCVKKLERVTAERDAAVADCQERFGFLEWEDWIGLLRRK